MSKSKGRNHKGRRRSYSSTARRSLPPSPRQMDLFPMRDLPSRNLISRPRSQPVDVMRQRAQFVIGKQPKAVSQPSGRSYSVDLARLWQPVLPNMDGVSKLYLCAKRMMRKEVLHARKKTGKVGQKRPVRTLLSNIKCGG